MNPTIAVFIMINNYFNDVATAMLLASGFTMWVITKQYKNNKGPEVISFLLRLYKGISKIVIASLICLTVSAIPRILTFSSFEWADAFDKNHVPVLIAKHLFAFGIVTGGVYIWIRLKQRITEIKGL